MLVLDENLPDDQQRLLLDWRIRFRIIGPDIASRGTADENLIPVLHRLASPTFATLDRDFYRPELVHPNYCLVWLDVIDNLAAAYLRQFLRHDRFNTNTKRSGSVNRVHPGGIRSWTGRARRPVDFDWHSRHRN